MPIKIRKLGRKGGPQGQDKVVPPNKKKLTPMPFKKKPKKKPMKAGGMMKKKGMAKGGKLRMVEKDGKKVPFFAADGKGKMAAGGTVRKKKKAKAGDTPMIPLGSSGYRAFDEGDKKVAEFRKALGIGKKAGGMMKKGYAKGGSVKVKSGDTLSQIAKSKGLTLKSLMAANPGIKNANEIRVGQSIKMPTDRAAMRSRVAFQNVDKNLNRRDNVYAGMTKSSMKALADDTAAKRAKKSGKPVSKKQSETANKRARVTTRLNQLGAINKERRAADAASASKPMTTPMGGKPASAKAKAASTQTTKSVTSSENKRLEALREKARRAANAKKGGGSMKKKGMRRGGMMKKKGMAKGGMMKKKGYAMGGMMRKKGMSKGGVMRGTGAATRGKRFTKAG